MTITTLFHILLLLYFYSMPDSPSSVKGTIYTYFVMLGRLGIFASEEFLEVLSMTAVQSRRLKAGNFCLFFTV